MSIAEKLTTIAENEQRVYDKGYADGQAQGGSDDYTRAFWEGFQNGGKRTDYSYAFRQWKNAHNYWYPIYNMSGASMMFYGFTSDLGLPELCEIAGVTIDWSRCTTFNQTFSYAAIPDIGTIDTIGANGMASMLWYSYVKKVHLILKDDGSQNMGSINSANSLTDLTVEGAIGTSWSLGTSPLNPESMINIIEHLVNYSGTDSEFVNSIKFMDSCWTALEAHSTAPDGNTWKEYVQNTLGWSV